MIFSKRKENNETVYVGEDLFATITVYSTTELEPDREKEVLDMIAHDFVCDKKILKGHTEGIRYEAVLKDQWINDDKDKASSIVREYTTDFFGKKQFEEEKIKMLKDGYEVEKIETFKKRNFGAACCLALLFFPLALLPLIIPQEHIRVTYTLL